MNALEVLQRVQQGRLILHREAGGRPTNWSLSRAALSRLAGFVTPETVSLETGCGLSTLLLGSISQVHHCCTLLAEETATVRAAAGRLGLGPQSTQYHVGDSAIVLPALDFPPLDLVLIDGAHAYPYPVLDWFYATRCLRAGGILAVDDTWMPSVRQLTRFLDAEPGWCRTLHDGQTTWYERTDAPTLPSSYPDRWDRQGINARVGARNRELSKYSTLPTQLKLRHPLLTVRALVGKVRGATRDRWS